MKAKGRTGFRPKDIATVARAAELAREFMTDKYPELALVPMHWWQKSWGPYVTYVDARGTGIPQERVDAVGHEYSRAASAKLAELMEEEENGKRQML